MKFYNRETELEKLEKLHSLSQGNAFLTVMTGRRRVGKTELIKHFITNRIDAESRKDCIYIFVDIKQSKILLGEISEKFKNSLSSDVFVPDFASWDELFRFIFILAKKKQFTIIFDEFQNFKFIDKGIFSTLQKYWDENAGDSKILLIAVGSFVGLMKNTFQDYKSPLYGRVSSFFALKPFNYETTRKILRDMDYENEVNIMKIYAVFGGVPKHYLLLENYNIRNANFNEILMELVVDSDSPLRNEVRNILIQEFGRENSIYFSILEAISRGKCSLVDIANYLDIAPNSLNKYLQELTTYYEIIERKVPATEDKPERSKKGRYFIKDNFFRFWFRFIYPNASELEISNFKRVFEKIDENINAYTGSIFEDVCREFLVRCNNKKIKSLNLNFNKIGSWWDRKGNEIDIAAIGDKEILLGECKWTNKKVDVKIAASLVEKSEFIKTKLKKRFVLFSKAGFTEGCVEYMREEDISYIELSDMEGFFDL